MSARSKRSTSSHTSTSTTSRQSTHQLNETSEVTSPMTPGKKSRDEEKAHLQNLNDRLATYIDRVRFLEGENSKLTSQIVTIEEKTSREISTQKNLYDTELAEARRVLDETAQEKARLQIEATSRKSELEELKQRLLRKEREVEGLDARLLGLEATNNDLRSRLSQANSEKKKLEDQLKESNREVDKLSRQLESAKKQLEQETLARVGVENKLLTLSDKLKFMEECHDKEISETKRIAHMEKTDIDHRLKDHYEQQMKDNLRELRENHEEQLRISRKEIEEKYQDLQDELQRKLDLLMSSTNSTTEEMHTYKTRADNIASQMDDLKAQLESMKNRKKDLEKMLEQEREWHRNALRNKDNEIRQLTEQLNRQLKEFHDVLDTNVGINSELAVYEKLLEAEECRLNLSKEDSLSGTTPTRRGAPSRKRKRVVQMEEEESQKEQSSSGGLLEIVDQDPQGSYIKIHNRSSQEMPLGGYVLVRESGEDNSCRYKFTRHVNIKPKSDITEWLDQIGEHVALHKAYRHKLEQFQDWVKNLRNSVDTNLDLGDINGLGSIKAVLDCEKEGKEKSSSLSEALEKVLCSTHAIGHGPLRAELKEAIDQWQAFIRVCRYWEQAARSVQHHAGWGPLVSTLADWIMSHEARLPDHALCGSLPDKQQQLEKLKMVQQDILSHQAMVDNICDKVQQLAILTNNSSLNNYVTTTKHTFEDLCNKVKDMLRKCEQNIREHQKYATVQVEFKEFIKVCKEGLSNMADPSNERAELQERKRQLEDQYH